MTISKPYTFSPGTKAKASEVNDNFDVVYRQVNDNTTNIVNNEVSINDLEVNKANKTGSSDTQFNVANPVNGYNAVNKQSMETAINPFKKIIYGLTLRMNSSTQIGIDEGSCYGTDGTSYDTPLILTTSTTLNLSGTDTSERPIYITGNSDGTNVQISITNVGVDRYRKIGSVWTNAETNIIKIYSYGIDKDGVSADRMFDAISPDYEETIIDITLDKDGAIQSWIAPSYGWLMNNTASNLSINGSASSTANVYGIIAFLNKGDIVYSTSNTPTTYHFLPCKGV